MTITFYECDDCGLPPYKPCRKCGATQLCKKCYNILHGLCADCREIEINGDDNE